MRQCGTIQLSRAILSSKVWYSLRKKRCSINSPGQIVGLAMKKSTGELHGYLATPSNLPTARDVVSSDAPDAYRPMAVPEGVRKVVLRRLGIRRR
ncbi:hypothetical protein SBA4_1170012 [Candidatus Sulfopaludibacter sp. SbA4]|nr:hypothetical protein SBA4_1170012 [Candidatus Sulfopaludibacter sp. SbA4]